MKIDSVLMAMIPQISYDIVGRIMPGITVIVSWIIVYLGPEASLTRLKEFLEKPDIEVKLGVFLLIAVLSYFTSATLFGIWKAASCICTWIKERRKSCDKSPKKSTEQETPPSEAFMFDWIRVKLPEAGSRLVKLRAEYHSGQILIVGWTIACVSNLYPVIVSPSTENIILEAALIIATVGMCFFRDYILSGYRINLKDHWNILHASEPEHTNN